MNIREAKPEDYLRLVEFWNKNSGWDEISIDTWKERFIDTPSGPSVILIAETPEKIIATLVVIRLRIVLGHRIFLGCRPFAAITDKKFNKLTGYKYIVQLIRFSYKVMHVKGYDLLIMLPDPRWKRILRYVVDISVNFPLFKLEIDKQLNDEDRPDIITKAISFDASELDILWDEVKAKKVYMISRNREELKWKNSHRDYKIIGVYQDSKLIGISTYLEKVQDKQIQICEVIYGNKDYKKTILLRTSKFISKIYQGDDRFNKMVILVTNSLKKSLLEIGYTRDNYEFLFMMKILNKKITRENISISNWYLSAND